MINPQISWFELYRPSTIDEMVFSNEQQKKLVKSWIDEETMVDLETAKMISVSCCAQVSYRKLDDSIEKAKKIYSMLNISSTDKPSHASPCEHQATPMLKSSYEDYTNLSHLHESWEDGITHVRKNGSLWSGNLQGWIQERQLISNEAVW